MSSRTPASVPEDTSACDEAAAHHGPLAGASAGRVPLPLTAADHERDGANSCACGGECACGGGGSRNGECACGSA